MRWGAAVLVLAGCGRIGFDPLANGDGGGDSVDGVTMSACPARDVDVGREHVCMVDQAGGVWCWGSNYKGQVEPSTTSGPVPTPTRVALSGPAARVALGRAHTCALLEDGSAWCWGQNGAGQLGDGTMNDAPGAVRVVASEPADELDAGVYMGCIRRISDHALECWGANQDGELGVPGPSATPRLIPGTENARQISIGHRHGCIINDAGALICWGRSGSGQILGAPGGTTLGTLGGLDPVAQVGVTSRTSCVAELDGNVRCFGNGRDGQLGNGIANDTPTPVTVPMSGAVEVEVGIRGACARRADGTVACWGSAYKGDGTFDPSPDVRESLLTGATKLALGYSTSCAIANGDVVCWGPNELGELGRGTLAQANSPVNVNLGSVLGGMPLAQVSVGYRHACIRAGTSVVCWGENDEGQVGDGTRTRRVVPTTIATGLTTIDGIATGTHATCAWGNGTVRCWGNNTNAQLANNANQREPSPVTSSFSGTTINDVALGPDHSCAAIDGSVRCVGANGSGQLGDGTATSSATPVSVVIAGVATRVAAGDRHSCAVVSGNVWCWGDNFGGRLGDGSQVSSRVPVQATIPATVTALTAGNAHACALAGTGQVYCWGDNDYGELGVGDNAPRLSPTLVTLPLPATSVNAGAETTCAHLVNDTVMCWGYNGRGQLGNGTTQHETSPQPVALVNTQEIDVGGNGVCARRGNALACWGHQAVLADGDDSSTRPMPVLVPCP